MQISSTDLWQRSKGYNGEKIVISTHSVWTTGHSHAKKVSLDTDPSLFTKFNTIWIIDLSVKCKNIKLQEDDIDRNLEECGFVMIIELQYQRHTLWKK